MVASPYDAEDTMTPIRVLGGRQTAADDSRRLSQIDRFSYAANTAAGWHPYGHPLPMNDRI
jgi:hypothetical protein